MNYVVYCKHILEIHLSSFSRQFFSAVGQNTPVMFFSFTRMSCSRRSVHQDGSTQRRSSLTVAFRREQGGEPVRRRTWYQPRQLEWWGGDLCLQAPRKGKPALEKRKRV